MGECKAAVVQESVLLKYLFDGTLLYINNEPLELFWSCTSDASNIKLIYRLDEGASENGNRRIYNPLLVNIIHHRGLNMLTFNELNRKNMAAAQKILTSNFTVVPGFFTTGHHCNNGYRLCVDVILKLLRKDTAMDVMERVRRNPNESDYKVSIRIALVEQVVRTPYDNKTYRIYDVDFDSNPSSKFHQSKEGQEMSLDKHIRSRYNISPKNLKQPILICHLSRRRGVDHSPVYLIPELSCMTGLADEQYADFRRKKLKPDRRVIVQTPGPELTDEFEKNLCSVLEPKTTIKTTNYTISDGDWHHIVHRKIYCVTVELKKWIVLFPSEMMDDVQKFMCSMKSVDVQHNIKMSDAVMVPIKGDRKNNYLDAIRAECAKSDQVKMILVILRGASASTYRSVTQLSLCELGIPSQVLTGRILRGDARQLMSASTKVTIQVASKLGAEPCRDKIPLDKLMVSGLHVYQNQRNVVGSFVTSLNTSFTRYYSSVHVNEGNNEDISLSLKEHMLTALKAYYKLNNHLPEKMVFYRQGVGASDTQRVQETEIVAIKEACCQVVGNHVKKVRLPTVCFIVVSKRFLKNTGQNVKDQKVTMNKRYEFLLAPQKITEESVSPTRFYLVEDMTGISPQIHQKLAGALTYIYCYRKGSLRVPAPVQYAHNLAFLFGESGFKKPMESIGYLPYFL